eukprot:s4261_g10.t1
MCRLKEESDADEDEDTGGVWAEHAAMASEPSPVNSKGSGSRLWDFAVTGALPEFAQMLLVQRIPVPETVQYDIVPDRMYYWQLRQYVESLQEAFTEEGQMARARRSFWSAALVSVLSGTTEALQQFEAFFVLPEWWTYDLFVTAADIGLVVPDACRDWVLEHFVIAASEWHQRQSYFTLIKLQEKMSDAISLAYNGRRCWDLKQRMTLSELLCVDVNFVPDFEAPCGAGTG